MGESTLAVGELGRRAGVGAKAIRFWEARGVLPPPARGANGYRLYAPETVEVLRFVRQAQDLGLSLAEIRQIASIRRGGRAPRAHAPRPPPPRAPPAPLDRAGRAPALRPRAAPARPPSRRAGARAGREAPGAAR